jgi:hypothetical protein
MAITDTTIVSMIGILEDGQLQIRKTRRLIDDQTKDVIAEQHHRFVLLPGEDVTKQSKQVQAVATLVWTPEVIKAFKAATATREL